MGNKIELTDKEKKIIRYLQKQSNKYKSLMFAGIFSLIVGLILAVGTIIISIPGFEIYILAGIFFITVGINTIINNLKHKQIYQLIERILEN